MKINIKLFLTIWTALLISSTGSSQDDLSGEITLQSCASSIQVTGSGGYPAYEYEWSGPTINNDNFYLETIEDVIPGQYCVIVSDLLCMNFQACIDITCNDLFSGDGCGIVVQDFGSNQFCGESGTGFIDIEVFPTNGAYTYRWSKNGQMISSEQDLTGITEGEYTVLINTAFGCSITETFNICCCIPDLIGIGDWPFDVTEVPQIDNSHLCAFNIEFGNLLEGVVTHASGANAQDGAIDLLMEPSNTISFSWTYNGTDFPGNGPDLTNLNPGLYCIDMDYGCNGVISACFLVLDQSCTDFDFVEGSNIIPQCGIENNGGIDITLSSEFEPYTFSWDIASQNEDLTNLSAGDYCVTITGSNGCTGSECFTVGTVIEPNIQSQNVVHPTNASLGSIELELTGSVGQVLWSNGTAGTSSITGLEAGNYCVTITTDGNSNCEVVECFDLEQLCDIDDIPVSITGSICGNGGSITLDIDPSSIISWRDENGMFLGNGPSITDLGPGQYCASISAVNNGGCIFCYDIVDSGGEISNVQWYHVCGSQYELSFDGAELPVTLTGVLNINGFTVPFDQSPLLITSNPFIVDFGGNTIEGVLIYTLESSGNCSSTYNGSYNYTGYADFNVSIPPENIEPCELGVIDNEGSLTVNILAGEPPYEIAWSTGAINQETIIVDESGTYCVTVTDACGDVESTCVEQNCQSLNDTYNNDYCAREFGVIIERDCPCINNCGGLLGDLDNSDLEIEVFDWSLILGTLQISVFNPQGELIGQVTLNNGNGQQQFIGSSEIDIADEDCSMAGEYTVSIYPSWLSTELTCTFTFSCEHTVCTFANGTWGTNGSTVGYNYNYSFGCYECNTCELPDGYVNDLSFWCDVQEINVIAFIPNSQAYPCQMGGRLIFNCPCYEEPITIEIPSIFGQFVSVDDGSVQDYILDPFSGIDYNIPCEDPIGFCVFDGSFLADLNIPDLQSNSDYYLNDLVTVICEEAPPTEEEEDPPFPTECEEGDRVIFLDEQSGADDDPCTVQYFCSRYPDVIHTYEYLVEYCHEPLGIDNPDGLCLVKKYCGCHLLDDWIATSQEGCVGDLLNPSCICNIPARPESLGDPLNSVENNKVEFYVFPNPVQHSLNIKSTLSALEAISISLVSIDGKRTKELVLSGNQGVFNTPLNVPEGLYILTVKSDYGDQKSKIVVVD